jgi:hypothetical protein
MHATQQLHNHIKKLCQAIDPRRLRAVFAAVEALSYTGRLTLTSLGRSLRSRAEVKHNIKRMDRLLGNERLYNQLEPIYAAVAQYILGSSQNPIIVVDWTELSQDGSYQLLRAAVPVDGRALSIYEEVHPQSKLNNARVHRRFLKKLKKIVGDSCCPIVVTDAGFQTPWFKTIEKMQWHWVGRVCSRTMFQWSEQEPWIHCKSLYDKASCRSLHLGRVNLTKSNPSYCYLYLRRNKKRGRVKRTVHGNRCCSHHSKKNAARQNEPWLLASSLDIPAEKLIKIYRKRMQIEENFRDMKNTRWGFCLRETRTNNAHRLSILVLIGTLAHLAIWLLGRAAQRKNLHFKFQANTVRDHKVLSTPFLGSQILLTGKFPIRAPDIKQAKRELNSIVGQEAA